MKQVKKRITSGKIVIRYKREKISAIACPNCGTTLHGVPRLYSSKIGKLSKSEKKPNRSFGGHFCSSCTREIFRERARSV